MQKSTNHVSCHKVVPFMGPAFLAVAQVCFRIQLLLQDLVPEVLGGSIAHGATTHQQLQALMVAASKLLIEVDCAVLVCPSRHYMCNGMFTLNLSCQNSNKASRSVALLFGIVAQLQSV